MTKQEFVDALNTKFSKLDALGNRLDTLFSLDKSGPKYTRVIRSSPGTRSVYCFIDHEGNIYKAAGWKAPAKGIRANLATVDMARVDEYGAWLYR